jgi:hypothetical protein
VRARAAGFFARVDFDFRDLETVRFFDKKSLEK